jgi:hypothetical protein
MAFSATPKRRASARLLSPRFFRVMMLAMSSLVSGILDEMIKVMKDDAAQGFYHDFYG